jgi:hypothetical protein
MTKTHDFSTFADDMIAIIRDGAASSNLGRTTRTSRTVDPKPLLHINNPGTTCGGHAVRLTLVPTISRKVVPKKARIIRAYGSWYDWYDWYE